MCVRMSVIIPVLLFLVVAHLPPLKQRTTQVYIQYNNNNFIFCYLSECKDNILPTITTTTTFNSACTFMLL